MPEVAQDPPIPQTAAERRALLVSLMGEANVRELEEVPVTDAQRRQLAEIVKAAPRRLASERPGGG